MTHDQNKKTLRHFQCRDYLWEIFEQMSQELECSTDYLINEAMRQYARSRNYGTRSPSVPGMRSPSPSQAPPSQIPSLRGGNSQRPAIPSAPPPPPSRGPSGGYGGGGGYGAPPPQQPGGYGAAGGGGYGAPPPQQGYGGGGGYGAPPPQQGYGGGSPGAYGGGGGGYGVPPQQQGYGGGGGYGQARPAAPSSYPPPSTNRPPGFGPSGAPPPLPGQGHAPIGGLPSLFVIFNGQKIPINKTEFVIGRGSKTADLPIKDGNISRRHAAVVFENGRFIIKDLGSTNGIEFGGQRVDNKPIDEGDVFQLCDYELRFTYR